MGARIILSPPLTAFAFRHMRPSRRIRIEAREHGDMADAFVGGAPAFSLLRFGTFGTRLFFPATHYDEPIMIIPSFCPDRFLTFE